MKHFSAILAALTLAAFLLPLTADARVNPPLPPAPLEETESTEMYVTWRRDTREITVHVPEDCCIVLAEYSEDGRMARARCAETSDGKCAFSDDVEGETVKMFTISADGIPLCPAMDLSQFVAWYQGRDGISNGDYR